MKLKLRITSLILIFLFMQTFLIQVPVKALDKTAAITFADSGLEKAVRFSLSKYTGPITIADMETLSRIDMEGTGATNLAGLEYAVNLTAFRTANSNIEDFTPIKNLTSLQIVYISRNKGLSGNPMDISFLENLTNLKELYIFECTLKDTAPIGKLVNLEYAWINRTNLEDVTPFGKLLKLGTLKLEENNIRDISPLSSLKKLKYLGLEKNKINNISGVSGLDSLTTINLRYNELKDVMPLLALAADGRKMYNVSVDHNYIDISKGSEFMNYVEKYNLDSTFIGIDPQTITFNDDKLRAKLVETLGWSKDSVLNTSDLKRFTELNLDDSDITDLKGLENAINLVSLSINKNNIKSLAPLRYLENLTELSAASNYIEDLSPLQGLINLHYLDLTDNYIDKIDALKDLVDLEVLGLHANLVCDLSPLSQLIRLQVLDLGYNIVNNISQIGHLTDMIVLSLSSNNIEDISYLQYMKNLQVLDLKNNKINDISALNILKSNGAFNMEDSAVDVSYNYLNLSNGSQQAAYITNLKSGSTEVYSGNQFSSSTPKVTFSDPLNGDKAFPANLPVTLQFDKSIEAGANLGQIGVVGYDGKIISCTTTINNNKAVIVPSEKLVPGRRYIFQIPVGAFKATADGSVNDDYTVIFDTSANDTSEFRVTFDSQGGSVVSGKGAVLNAVITAPKAPVRLGYTFGGWYKEAAYVNAWNFAADKVTADTTLYAKWTSANFAVTFSSNGGSAVFTQLVLSGNKAVKPADPTKGGYKFGGWYTDQFPFTKTFDFSQPLTTGNVTLYARWIPTEAYIISYLQQTKDTKLFGIYNQAKAVIYESDLSEAKKGYYLGQLAQYDKVVFTDINKYFINRCIDIASNPNLTDFLALVDEIDAKLSNEIDKGYFKGQMNSWGRYRVYTPEVQASIDAIVQVWTLKTPESADTAKAAIATVKEAGSISWLNARLDEAVQAMNR